MLMTFNLNDFSVAATSLYEPYDAWIKPPIFLQFRWLAYAVAEYWWMLLTLPLMLHNPDN